MYTALKHVASTNLHKRKNPHVGLHKSVKSDVQKIMGNKISTELKILLADIKKSIHEDKRSDVEYWEQMEKEVSVEYSRAIVRETHRELLVKQFDIVRRYRAVCMDNVSEILN